MQQHIIIRHCYNQYTVDCCFIATESFTFLLLDSIDWFKYRLDLVCQISYKIDEYKMFMSSICSNVNI